VHLKGLSTSCSFRNITSSKRSLQYTGLFRCWS